jgi:hypothetical protein
MALGTVSVVKKGVLAPGGLKFVILNVQPTTGANYTANGETFAATRFPGFRNGNVYFFQATPKDEISGATYLVYDFANRKLLAHDAATGVEEAAAQDLSTFSYRVFAIGD